MKKAHIVLAVTAVGLVAVGCKDQTQLDDAPVGQVNDAPQFTEAARVVKPRGHVLLKCMDQVNGGKVRWQTIEFTNHAATVGLELVDMLHLQSYRAQPDGTAQQHARRNYSTLLVFEKRR